MIRKTIYAFCLIICIYTTVFAQKPVSRNVSTELIFQPFSSTPFTLKNMINGLKFRYFLKDKLALRTGTNIIAEGLTTYIPDQNGQPTGKRRTDYFSIEVMPGLEWHFSGTEKLSPYAGFDAGLGYKIQNEKLTNADEFYRYKENYNRERVSGSASYQLNLIAGADYYFTPKVFIGGELGLKNSLIQEKSLKTTYSGSAAPTVTPDTEPDKFGILIGVNAVSGIRLGIIF